jgi:hypothetical protein
MKQCVNQMCENNYIFVNKSDTIRESPCITCEVENVSLLRSDHE